MVSRDTKETALFVTVAVVGGVASLQVGAPDVVTVAVFFGFGVLGPTVRDEWRRRQDASPEIDFSDPLRTSGPSLR